MIEWKTKWVRDWYEDTKDTFLVMGKNGDKMHGVKFGSAKKKNEQSMIQKAKKLINEVIV